MSKVFSVLVLVAGLALVTSLTAQTPDLLVQGIPVPKGAVAILDGQTFSEDFFVDFLCQRLRPLFGVDAVRKLFSVLFLGLTTSLTAQTQNPLRQGIPVPEGAVAILDGQTISEDVFVDYLCQMFARPGHSGDDVVSALIDEAVVRAGMREKDVAVKDSEIEQKYRELDAKMRSETKRSLDDELSSANISPDAFRRKLRGVVGLEKLAILDLKLPAEKPVSNLQTKVWLNNARTSAVIDREQSNLPSDVLLMVSGEPVTKRQFAHDFLQKEKPDTIRRALDTLLQEVLLDRLLTSYGLRLGPDALLNEWEIRKKEFEETPQYKGLKYEDVVKQQTSWDPDRYRQSRGFKVHAGVSLIGRTQFKADRVAAAYEKYKDRFGPTLTIAHILIRASEDNRFRGTIPTFDEARRTTERILGEIQSGKRFEDLVTLYSEDPTSKFKGGRLPPCTPGNHNLDQALVDAATKLAEGRVADAPIKSRIGYHIVKLAGREPVPPLEKVEEQVRRLLSEDEFKSRFLGLKSRLGIDVRL